MKKATIIMLILLSGLGIAFGASTLGGYVTEPDGTTVMEGVGVQITGGASTTTDATGLYNFTSGISDQAYILHFTRTGYYKTITEPTVSGDTEHNASMASISYLIGDLDDIMIDVIGHTGAEVRSDVPTLVDLGVLYIIFVLIAMVLSGMVIAVLVIPKKLAPKTRL